MSYYQLSEQEHAKLDSTIKSLTVIGDMLFLAYDKQTEFNAESLGTLLILLKDNLPKPQNLPFVAN